MSFRQFVRDLIPPVLARLLRRLRHRVERQSPSTRSEPPIPNFSSRTIGSYSQYGEDLILDAALGFPSKGFFVDIGANDPTSLSNTKRFSLRGWKGINAEPNPQSFERIARDRLFDININVGVGAENGLLTFYSIDPDTLSTFNREIADRSLATHKGSRVVETKTIVVMRLDSLLDKYLPRNTTIDFLSLDVEGGEIDALRGNDWLRYRPRLMMIEVTFSGGRISNFLLSVGYECVWCNGLNALFLDRNAS